MFGVWKMPGNPNEIKLVNNAMSNATRRKIMNFLVDGEKSIEEIGEALGKTMLDFHLKLLQQAGLIELGEGTVRLSEYGRNFLKGKEEKDVEKSADLSQAKPIEITEVRQLLPCIADSSKFRVIANMAPSLGGTLKVFEPLFPRGRYSDKIGALIIQKGEVITTIYGTGKVTLTMIKSEKEAKEALESLRSTINEAISKGFAPAPREKIRVEPMEIYKYLPQTNCGKCGEQSCYTFAIKLMSGETSLDKCTPIKQHEYAINMEQLQVLNAYI
jgi:ArsR family metal-binding transcriptional regulator